VAAILARQAGVNARMVNLRMGVERKLDLRHVMKVGSVVGSNVYVHDSSERFVRELADLTDPEEKRKRFARMYAETTGVVGRLLNMGPYDFLIQGSIATDRRESGREAGKGDGADSGSVVVVKTHHNVGAEGWLAGNQIYPLRELTKDQVRIVARELGLPPEISERQPFPGPGLLIRLVTDYHPVDDDLYANVRDVAASHGLTGYVLPRKGVGLKGDDRAFEHVALLVGERDWKGRIRPAAKELIEDLPVCRVLYLPDDEKLDQRQLNATGTLPFNMRNLDLLREGTETVEQTMERYDVNSSQTPVITFGGHDSPWLVIRDVQSEDFRTVTPLKKPDEFPWECYDEIARESKQLGFGRVAFDVSDKPGGTTEME